MKSTILIPFLFLFISSYGQESSEPEITLDSQPRKGEVFKIIKRPNGRHIVINVYSLNGTLISSKLERDRKELSLEIDAEKGTYIIELNTKKGKDTFQIIKTS